MSAPHPVFTQAPPLGCDSVASCTAKGDVMPDTHPEMPPLGHSHIGFLNHLMPHASWTNSAIAHAGEVGFACIVTVALLTLLFTKVASWLAWTPARMRNWTLGAIVAIPGSEIAFSGFNPLAPLHTFGAGATAFLDDKILSGLLTMSVLLVPAAWVTATFIRTDRLVVALTTGFRNPANTKRFLEALTQRQQYWADRMARYPVPLTTGGIAPHPVLGRVAARGSAAPPRSRLQSLLPRHRSLFVLPWISTRQHLVTVAKSGSGKTTLLQRTLVSWYVTAWARHRQWWRHPRAGRPLAWLVDCNGGPESEETAEFLAKWARRLGTQRVAIFPKYTQFNLWAMSRDDMRAVLTAMVTGGSGVATSTEKFFYEMRETLIHLIVDAPERVENGGTYGGPPRSREEFLARFDPVVLAALWGGVWDEDVPWTGAPGADKEIAATMNSEDPVMISARAEFGNLFRELGDAFEGESNIEDFDWIICILNGTTQPERARAQYGALGALAEQLANRNHGRETLWATDEFSAVADKKTRADKWVQRMRKAHISTWWVTQSWVGLGSDDEQRQSLVDSAAGGGIHGRQDNPVKLAASYARRNTFEVLNKLRGHGSSNDDGTIRASKEPLLDADRLAGMEPGDVVYIRGRRVVYGHVTELTEQDYARARPLTGLGRFTRKPIEDGLAKVIDLQKRRPAS